MLVGAAAATRSAAPVASPRVWATAGATAAVALGSMAVNDYFDRAPDAVNAPHKPLPSGAVAPDGALLFAGALYAAAFSVGACVDPAPLRWLIAGSAGVTLVYTPVLKRIPLIKTASVAAVIAAAPAAGALAAAGLAGLPAVTPAVVFAFLAVASRELAMDAADARGDAAAGVATLAVLLGPTGGLAAAAAAAWVAAGILLAHAAPIGSAAVAAAALVGAAVAAPASAALARKGAARDAALRAAIDGAAKPNALGLLLMLALTAAGRG